MYTRIHRERTDRDPWSDISEVIYRQSRRNKFLVPETKKKKKKMRTTLEEDFSTMIIMDCYGHRTLDGWMDGSLFLANVFFYLFIFILFNFFLFVRIYY